MYSGLPFWTFALALAVVAAPAALMEAAGEDKWAWRYLLLILVVFSLAQWRGLTKFSSFVQGALKR
jgi:hypothetical protein